MSGPDVPPPSVGGHDHVLTLGISVGPLLLRVALLVAVQVVAGYALMRGFLGPPDRRTAAGVVGAAGAATVLELLLSGGLDLPDQLVPLLLVALAAPLYVLFSRDSRFAPLVGRLRWLAPWVCCVAGAFAVVKFVQALPSLSGRTAALHTGVVLALVALSWFVVSPRPRLRPASAVLLSAAAVLGLLALAGAAYLIAAQSLPA